MARTIDMDINHLTETLKRAAAHKGTAFVEVYQNCKIFNDGVFEYATDKSVKADNVLFLEHGKPLVFGKDRNKGIRLHGLDPEVVELGNGIAKDDLLIHDEKADEPSLAYLLSRMVYPRFPGVRRRLPLRRAADLRGRAQQANRGRHRRRAGPASSKTCSPVTKRGSWNKSSEF